MLKVFYRTISFIVIVAALSFSFIPVEAATSPPPNLYYTAAKSTLKKPDGSIQTKGLLIMAHSGGWLTGTQAEVDGLKPWADWYNSIGWATVNVDYRAGANSVNDVTQWYDWVNSIWGVTVSNLRYGSISWRSPIPTAKC